MPWLLNEESAVKRKFIGLQVTDENASSGLRDVMVRFRLPETELADLTFPLIVLNGPDISKADDREHRGPVRLPYAPEGQPRSAMVPNGEGQMVLWDTEAEEGFDVTLSPYKVADVPIPYNLDYQVTVLARKQSHLMSLISQLAQVDRIPARFGFLEIPENGTVRTLDLIGGPVIEEMKDQDSKRLFQAVYSIRVVSELDVTTVAQIPDYVAQVDLRTIRIEHDQT